MSKEGLIEILPQLAEQYIFDCINHTKEVATGSGKIVDIKERHIPTIAFFLNIWIPMNHTDTISRVAYYDWLRGDRGEAKKKVIEDIDEKFKALAGDIVANEQKGIFYAKNKLGWTDRVDTNTHHTGQINANFGHIIQPALQSTDNPQLDK